MAISVTYPTLAGTWQDWLAIDLPRPYCRYTLIYMGFIMSSGLRHLGSLLILLQSLASDAYVGLRGTVLLTSPGIYADTLATGLIGGYILPACC